MGSVSSSSMTRILNMQRSELLTSVCPHLMLGILLMALRGLRTLTVLMAERLIFSTSMRYSKAPERTMKQSSLFQVS